MNTGSRNIHFRIFISEKNLLPGLFELNALTQTLKLSVCSRLYLCEWVCVYLCLMVCELVCVFVCVSPGGIWSHCSQS